MPLCARRGSPLSKSKKPSNDAVAPLRSGSPSRASSKMTHGLPGRISSTRNRSGLRRGAGRAGWRSGSGRLLRAGAGSVGRTCSRGRRERERRRRGRSCTRRVYRALALDFAVNDRRARRLRRVQAPASGHRSARDPGVGRLTRRTRQAVRRRPRALRPLQAPEASADAACRPAPADPDPLHQHDLPRAGAVLSRRRGHGAPHPTDDPLERCRDGRPREPSLRRHRGSPRDVRVGREPVRGRLQPFLPRQGRRLGR